ncbi:MAG: hypothetical protein K2L95_02160 [Alphaproteobacteria bacterium]|nr:hypothetical protein [Alphaproteobacteria bacterium]
MTQERENTSPSSLLTRMDYTIAGNDITAFYDAAHKLVLVLDRTIDELKPNVLLVINPVGDRKWDDILANDYNVDLETVRPKKDNKYQKLDIEYSGLATYDRLINAYRAGENLDAVMADLAGFRNASIRRSATERLAVANDTADKARETIERTNDTIAELNAKLKELRAKLSGLRKNVGREPTKQSAAKILRTEAQIDATNEKLRRAKKRLQNAQRRLDAAVADADAAQAILDQSTDLVVVRPTPVIPVVPQFTEIITPEPKAEEMADEEVKPLFDKDPEILDEEIAFKPIDFNVSSVPAAPVASDVRVTETPVFNENVAPAPLSFTPPVKKEPAPEYVADAVVDAPMFEPVTPVLDTIIPVTPAPQPAVTEIVEPAIAVTPIIEPAATPVAPAPSAPINPMPEITPAPATSDHRPVSPITGAPVAPAGDTRRRKPTLLYYVMLILLIALSIFTLWLYQKSTNNAKPDLAATGESIAVSDTPTPAPQPVVSDDGPNPFIQVEPVDPAPVEIAPVEPVEIEPEPVIIPEPQPAPVEIMQPEPAPVVMPEPEPAIPEPVYQETDVTVMAPAPAQPVVNKPAYNVSQQEKMFVAAPDYETETMYTNTASDANLMCENGGRPDANGCCAGEIFTDMEDGTYACCTSDGIECFPPLF